MKRLFTKYGLIALAASTTVAVLLCLITFFSNNTPLLTSLAGTLSAPFRSLSTSISDWIESKQRYRDTFDALKEENEQLKLQIAQMEEALRQAELDSEENETLRRLLDLRQQRRDYEWESARIIQRDVSNWSSTLTLNAGTDCGVETGDCVITEAGFLVGVITKTGPGWSACTTVVDTDTSIGAKIFRTGEVAVAQGDFSLMEREALKLNYLTSDAAPQVGDLVVTSGLGGYYPSGLPIGYVEEVKTDDSGLAQYAILHPAADLGALKQLFIIKDFAVTD